MAMHIHSTCAPLRQIRERLALCTAGRSQNKLQQALGRSASSEERPLRKLRQDNRYLQPQEAMSLQGLQTPGKVLDGTGVPQISQGKAPEQMGSLAAQEKKWVVSCRKRVEAGQCRILSPERLEVVALTDYVMSALGSGRHGRSANHSAGSKGSV